MTRRRSAAALTGLIMLASAGCSRAVEVVPAAEATSPACAQVAAAWPATVSGQGRVATSSDSPAVAAWGDPAIIARCGAASSGPTTRDCIAVSGVDWVAEPLDDGTKFTTYGRTPAIEVLVPKDYSPEPLVLGAFTSPAQQIAQGPHRCR